MNIFAFSSNNLTNIWAGIGAQMWAISAGTDQTTKGRTTASKKMKVGSLGILYCKERKAFTTPFIVQSQAQPDLVIDDVWPEKWILPFRIRTLGTPKKLLSLTRAKEALPSLVDQPGKNPSHVFLIHGQLAFTPSKVTADDWRVLIEELAD